MGQGRKVKMITKKLQNERNKIVDKIVTHKLEVKDAKKVVELRERCIKDLKQELNDVNERILLDVEKTLYDEDVRVIL